MDIPPGLMFTVGVLLKEEKLKKRYLNDIFIKIQLKPIYVLKLYYRILEFKIYFGNIKYLVDLYV